MKYKVIGITGPAHCGKSTAASVIINSMPEYVESSFAEPIKEMLRYGLGLSKNQLYGNEKETVDPRYGASPRHMMQTLGTEWGRNLIHPDVWVKAMDEHLTAYTVIPDVRFENEAAFVRERGILIHIGRKRVIDGNHVSESGVELHDSDIKINNHWSFQEFQDNVNHVVRCFLK